MNLVTHERHTSTFNTTTEATKTEGTGEVVVKISGVRIDQRKNPGSARAQPSVDKAAFASGTIARKAELARYRGQALMKWALESPELRLEVCFWRKEIWKEGYRFIEEVMALSAVKNVDVRIPNRRVGNVETESGGGWKGRK